MLKETIYCKIFIHNRVYNTTHDITSSLLILYKSRFIFVVDPLNFRSSLILITISTFGTIKKRQNKIFDK